MEKGHEIRVIGGASEEKKEEAKKEILNALFNHYESMSQEDIETMERLEYDKSEQDIRLIDFANRATNELMQKAGVSPYNIPVENYHIVPSELYQKATKNGSGIAVASHMKQGILLNAEYLRNKSVCLGATMIHETLHLKSHFSLEVEEEGEKIKKTPYRTGVTVQALQKYGFHGSYHDHFSGLHEAIVAETEKRLLPKMLDEKELVKQKEWLESEDALKLKNEIAAKEEIPVGDIFWVGKKGAKDWGRTYYLGQRNVLHYVCSEIQKQFADKYKSADEVYEEFLGTHFTGRLLPIARLVEKTFGEGSFRLLGNMETDNQSAVLVLESMKKARARILRMASTN